MLTTVKAWQENQVEVAERLFASSHELLSKIKPAASEKIGDGLFQIGKGLLSKRDYPMAEKWLQRAWDVILSQPLQDMSRDAVELRMAVFQALVAALLGMQTTESIEKAQNLTNYVHSDIGDQPVVLLVSLELLNQSPGETFDGEAYGHILRRMITSLSVNENNFKLFMSHIHLLHLKCPALGCSLVDEFLAVLVKGGHTAWIDKLVVIRIKMATTHRDFDEAVQKARKAVSRLERPVSADASIAAQTVRLQATDLCGSRQDD